MAGRGGLQVTIVLKRLALFPIALLLVGASPAEKLIPLPGDDAEALVVPAASPVRFAGFNKSGDQAYGAHFSGRFVVEGTFVLDCNFCEPGVKDNQLSLSIVPDASTAARLPHWKVHDNEIAIGITRADSFIRTISTPEERSRLLSGKLDQIKGRATLVLDHFEADLDCDSADYSARFVAVAKAPVRDKVELAGDYGCGGI
jgi:hypothetical protein